MAGAVVVFHAASMLNSAGSPMAVGAGNLLTGALPYLIYPWVMAGMFLLAGISARYALERRRAGEFLRERARKLLLPLLGTVVLVAPALVWFTAWSSGITLGELVEGMRWYFGSRAVATFFLVLTGLGPAWFLPELFFFSLLLLPTRRLRGPGRVPLWGLLLLILPCWGAAQTLTPDNRHLLYLLAFFLGYFVLDKEETRGELVRWRVPLGVAALLLGGVVLRRWWGVSYGDEALLKSLLVNAFLWVTILALLGWGQAVWQRTGPHDRAWGRWSFTLYLFHYLPTLAAARWTAAAGLGLGAGFALTTAVGFALPTGLYLALRRTPLLGDLFCLREKQKK